MIFLIKKKNLYIILTAFFVIAIIMLNIINFLISSSTAENAINRDHEYSILIQIDEKKLYLYEDGTCIKQYPIASGRPHLPSPIGDWEITDKGKWGKSFGGRWLGLNVKWGNYGIHGTTNQYSIGRAASHGCIRMFNKDIIELYDIVPIGTPVIIRNGSFGPFGTGFRNLIPGDRGADVLAVQERLKTLGYFSDEETGIYENNLKIALNKFQKDHNLKIKHTITLPDYNAMGFREFE